MTHDGRLEALKTKHATLDEALLAELARKHPDDLKATRLKREKLRVKDEMERLKRH